MPMERERYPKDWKAIATAVKEEADWKCEECGKHMGRDHNFCPNCGARVVEEA